MMRSHDEHGGQARRSRESVLLSMRQHMVTMVNAEFEVAEKSKPTAHGSDNDRTLYILTHR